MKATLPWRDDYHADAMVRYGAVAWELNRGASTMANASMNMATKLKTSKKATKKLANQLLSLGIEVNLESDQRPVSKLVID